MAYCWELLPLIVSNILGKAIHCEKVCVRGARLLMKWTFLSSFFHYLHDSTQHDAILRYFSYILPVSHCRL